MQGARSRRLTLFAAVRREALAFVVLAITALSFQTLVPTIAAGAPSGSPLASLCITAGSSGEIQQAASAGGLCCVVCTHGCCHSGTSAPTLASLPLRASFIVAVAPEASESLRPVGRAAYRSRDPPSFS